MYKIGTIFGTRPEIIKLSSVIKELDKHTEQILINTNQNFSFGLNEILFQDLGIRNADFNLGVSGKNASQTIANTIQKTDDVLSTLNLDAILIYGDTNSAFSAVAAKKRKVPIFHMEAGNRSFDMRVPEEFNRIIIDKAADINMVLSEHARQNLISEGFPAHQIFKVGSHLPEVYASHRQKISSSKVLSTLRLEPRGYFLASFHREENVDNPETLKAIIAGLEKVSFEFNLPTIVSTHARTQQKIESLRDLKINENLKFLDPFCFTDFVRLSMDAKCIISDSGSAPEEAAILGTQTVVVREAHERLESMEAGCFILSGLESHKILNSVMIAVSQNNGQLEFKGIQDYKNNKVSSTIRNIVLSNISSVNANTWKKNKRECT